MAEPLDPLEPQHLRVSDADRHRVAEVLRQAAGEGRLEIEELEERLEATYAAKTYADLVPITLDLPGAAVEPRRPATPRPPRFATPAPEERQGPAASPVRWAPPGTPATYDATLAVMSESRRSGEWDVGAEHAATGLMGSVVIDLRQARFPAEGEVVINANAVMGSVEVVVDAWTEVRVEGVAIMGSYSEGRSRVPSQVTADAPLVRLRGFALMGSVEVKRKRPPRDAKRLTGRWDGH